MARDRPPTAEYTEKSLQRTVQHVPCYFVTVIILGNVYHAFQDSPGSKLLSIRVKLNFPPILVLLVPWFRADALFETHTEDRSVIANLCLELCSFWIHGGWYIDYSAHLCRWATHHFRLSGKIVYVSRGWTLARYALGKEHSVKLRMEIRNIETQFHKPKFLETNRRQSKVENRAFGVWL